MDPGSIVHDYGALHRIRDREIVVALYLIIDFLPEAYDSEELISNGLLSGSFIFEVLQCLEKHRCLATLLIVIFILLVFLLVIDWLLQHALKT